MSNVIFIEPGYRINNYNSQIRDIQRNKDMSDSEKLSQSQKVIDNIERDLTRWEGEAQEELQRIKDLFIPMQQSAQQIIDELEQE